MSDDPHATVWVAIRNLDGIDDKLLRDPGVIHIPSILEDGELPEAIAKIAGLDILGATDRRLIVVGKSMLSDTVKKVKSYPYSDIHTFDADRGMFAGCTMRTSGGKSETLMMDRKYRQRVAAVVQSHLDLYRTDPEILIAGQSNKESGKIVRIDEQWQALNPSWGKNQNKGEHGMLYTLIEDGEELECIVGGRFGPDLGQARIGESMHSGIIVATNQRVLMVDKGMFGSTEVAEIAYRNIEAMTYSTGMFAAGLRITGRGTMHFRIESIVPKEAATRFADCVRSHLEERSDQQEQSGAVAPVVDSAARELETLANLMDRGVLSREEFDAKKKQLLGL